ncbi:MAG: serine/threonine protein kinase [Alphaproteobacteria bacterium]|nr:serine/threonine protein kinase [Alphaproteobacteria bacterium]
MLLHATCVSVGGKGVLLLGESGSGKSDLALRLIDAGAQLVADDQVFVSNQNGLIMASPAQNIAGLIEARGVGLLKLPHLEKAPIFLAIQLVSRVAVERLPEQAFFDCLGIAIPLLSLHAFDDSTVAKIRLYLSQESV